MNQNQFNSLLRTALKLGGAFLAAHGAQSSTVELIGGIVTALAGVLWSHWTHSDAKSPSNGVPVSALLIGVGVISGLAFAGCADPASTAIRSDATAITGVNAAMVAWADYVHTGSATTAQITTVSNAYNLYYNAELVASNAAYLYTVTPTTNVASGVTLALGTLTAAQSNLVNIVQQLTQ